MFITVRYGDAEEALFNPHCRTLHLLQSIKRCCRCPDDVKVDLSDVNGVVKNLTDHEGSPASDLLSERETFILVRVDSKEGNTNPVYTPLLHNDDLVTTEFLESLHRTPADTLEVSGRQSRHSTRRASLKTTGKSKMSGNLNLNATGGTGTKSPTGKRRGSVFKQKGS